MPAVAAPTKQLPSNGGCRELTSTNAAGAARRADSGRPFGTPRGFYRAVSVAEAITWTVLIVGMLLKYVAGLGSLPVLVGGSVHGFVFLSFAGASLLVGVNQRWQAGRIVGAVAMAIVPYGTVPFDARLDRRGALDGPWHAEHSGQPHDDRWLRALLRWFLARPMLLGIVFVLVVLVVMGALLLIGPPGGWS